MYIDPFVAGAIVGAVAMFALMILFSAYYGRKK